jgi:hypothetical protein
LELTENSHLREAEREPSILLMRFRRERDDWRQEGVYRWIKEGASQLI